MKSVKLEVSSEVYWQFAAQINNQARNPKAIVWYQLDDQVDLVDQVWNKVWSQVVDQVRDQS